MRVKPIWSVVGVPARKKHHQNRQHTGGDSGGQRQPRLLGSDQRHRGWTRDGVGCARNSGFRLRRSLFRGRRADRRWCRPASQPRVPVFGGAFFAAAFLAAFFAGAFFAAFSPELSSPPWPAASWPAVRAVRWQAGPDLGSAPTSAVSAAGAAASGFSSGRSCWSAIWLLLCACLVYPAVVPIMPGRVWR